MEKPTSIADVVFTLSADTEPAVKKLRVIAKHLSAMADELEEIDREADADADAEVDAEDGDQWTGATG